MNVLRFRLDFSWLWINAYLSLMALLTLKWRRDWLEHERQEEDLNQRIPHHQSILPEFLPTNTTERCESQQKSIFIFYLLGVV